MLISLVATFGYALYNLSTCYLAGFDPSEVTQTFTPFAGAVVLVPFALSAWQWPQGPGVWVLLALLGLWGGLGHWPLILAPSPCSCIGACAFHLSRLDLDVVCRLSCLRTGADGVDFERRGCGDRIRPVSLCARAQD
jgi:hypothetical protein